MAKKSKSKSKAKKLKRDDDLFAQLREQGVRKSVADQIARASAGLDSGKKKAEQGVRDAAESFRKLAADLEAKLPGDTEVVPEPAARRTTAAKKPATRRTTTAKKPAARRTTKSTAASRSAAAKKAAATRKRNAAAKKAAETRAEGSS